MEIELKYHIGDSDVIDRIFSDEKIVAITDCNSEETIEMQAAYFDTEDRRLSREGVAFRVRREGSRIIGTLKWNGHSEDGMHEREEINVPVLDESKLTEPDVDIFRQSGMCSRLKELIGERRLIRVMEIRFLRRQIRIDTGKAICELSADTGKVFCGGKSGPISELEVELYSGSRQEMESFGAELAEKFGLEPENRSKFRQGLELLH